MTVGGTAPGITASAFSAFKECYRPRLIVRTAALRITLPNLAVFAAASPDACRPGETQGSRMPYVLTCPACSSRMKTPEVVPAGTLVECPKCSTQFTTKFDSPEFRAAGAPAKSGKSRSTPEEILDEADVVDDEPVKPRGKKRPAERDEDEEDDRPRRSKKRSTADEEEDQESDSRPRKNKKKKKSPLVLILAIGLPLLFLICGGAGYGVYSYVLGGGPSSDMLAWAPSDSDQISGVSYAKISSHSNIRRMFEPKLNRLAFIGVDLNDVEEALIARSGGSEVFVVRTKTKIDTAKLVKSANATEANVNGKTYHKGPQGAFHVPSPKMLVVCSFENAMTDLLKKDAKVTRSDDMKSLAGKASGDFWEVRLSKSTVNNPNVLFNAPKSTYAGGRIIGNQLRITQTMVFSSENEAKLAESNLKTTAQLIKTGNVPGRKLPSFDVSSSGNTVTFSAETTLEDNNTIIFGGF